MDEFLTVVHDLRWHWLALGCALAGAWVAISILDRRAHREQARR